MALSKHCRHGRAGWGKCRCSWYWDGYVNGRRTYRNLETTDRTEARRKAAQIEADRLDGRISGARHGARVSDVADRWLEHVERLGRRPQTIRAYRTAANAVIGYFGPTMDVRRIDHREVERFESDAWAKRKGEGPRSLMAGLWGILKQAKRDGLIEVVPQGSGEQRTVPPNPNVRMTEAETNATLAELRNHWKVLGEFIVLTGLRVGECLALRWSDVDFERGTLSVEANAEQHGNVRAGTKTTKSTRQFRPDPAALALLKTLKRRDERLWPYRYRSALIAINGAMDRAGTNAPRRAWHSLRHQNTALRNKVGQSLRDAAAELGHGANFAMTMAYGWSSDSAVPAEVSKVRQQDRPSDDAGQGSPDDSSGP